MRKSMTSLESLVVPCLTEEPPDLSPPKDNNSPSPAKLLKTSMPLEDFSLPPEMMSAYSAESARLQSSMVCQSFGKRPAEPEKDRRMYVPNLSQSMTRRDIFTHFYVFGDLERVFLNNGPDSPNYAIVLFFRAASMQLAIAANPHSINGHRLICRKATDKTSSQVKGQAMTPKPVRTVAVKNPQTVAAKTPEKSLNKKQETSDLIEHVIAKKSLSLNHLDKRPKTKPMSSMVSVVPLPGDQTFVYSKAKLEGDSRWKFSLARSFTTQEEKEALRNGHPDAAKKLLEARLKNGFINFIKPTTPTTPTLTSKPWPDPLHSPKGARFPFLLPPPSPQQPTVTSQQEPISISKPDLKQINSASNVNRISSVLPPKMSVKLHTIFNNPYFGPDFRYEHHCYTNVVAYQKTKLYIDLEPGEREKRQTISEFIEAKYGLDIKKH